MNIKNWVKECLWPWHWVAILSMHILLRHHLPENVDEYMLAGFLRKKKVELVKCITQPDIEVPADADFVIEGYVDPDDELIWEGPFGDHTGYYSLPDWYPRFHITCYHA